MLLAFCIRLKVTFWLSVQEGGKYGGYEQTLGGPTWIGALALALTSAQMLRVAVLMWSCGNATPSWDRLGLNPLRLLSPLPAKPHPTPREEGGNDSSHPEGYGNVKCLKLRVKFLANCLGAGKNNAGQYGYDCVAVHWRELPTAHIPKHSRSLCTGF